MHPPSLALESSPKRSLEHMACFFPLPPDSLVVSSEGEQVNSAHPQLVVRTLTLESLTDDESDTVKIYHYTNWPQYGKPQ